MAAASRIARQFAFLNEADRLKGVDRANLILDCSREENSAEHSWHLMLYAMVFGAGQPPEVDVDRAILMLMLHDLVEIDAGDHPIHLDRDPAVVAAAEKKAADRLFGILPDDQGAHLRAIWDEFEAGQTPTAAFARRCDIAQPMFQTICGASPRPDHIEIVRDNMSGGRARPLAEHWAEAYEHAAALLNGADSTATDAFLSQLAFVNEACQLKGIYRATRLHDGSRHENSAEHSWHSALHIYILAEHATREINVEKAVRMLVLHDLVEIDAGDNPIHGNVDHAAQEAAELAAADRLFNILPEPQNAVFRALWDEFEEATSPEAHYGKAIDRTSTPLANLANGGGSWVDYNVGYAQLVERVGKPISRGAPAVWEELDRMLKSYPLFAGS
ncbi:HD domain-containing protein [Marivivens donghaensis]|uniref:5'-deoxynucleotidase n=1 Tax=Marivivens donghaensis TaxID=1699413 RepID=A0ABX0VXK3_9RHOB|nr:HD domain-containing protein [Marivivens donghaensis]NIY72831.1 HD domain-containing protein [Marivivens donghaensis]